MFVQATKSKRQNKTYVSYLVRESFRTSQGPRSRTVCNLSALPPQVRELVAAALSGQTCVALEQIELSQALDYGGLAVLRDAWQRFGLEKLFADVPQLRQRRLLQAMSFGRILFPCAKLALAEQSQWHSFGRGLRALPTERDFCRRRSLRGHGRSQWPLGPDREDALRRGFPARGQPGAL